MTHARNSPFILLFVAMLLVRCTGGEHGNEGPSVSISVSPRAVNLGAGQQQRFTAVIEGLDDTAVRWSVHEGSHAGIIDTEGLYTAPAVTGTYHVVAVSEADPSRSNSATINVHALKMPLAVSIMPSAHRLVVGTSLRFTAEVTGSANTAVTWSVTEEDGGTIDDQGLYSAPSVAGTYHVVATSEADTTKSATATVTVTPFPTTGLVMHFAAEQLLGPTGTLPTDGSPVSSWVDLSGNARDLGQSNAARQPVFKVHRLNGRPTVVFDGSSTTGQGDYLRSAAFASPLPQPLTVFLVYKGPQVDVNKTLMDAPPGAGPHRIRLQATTVPSGSLQLYTSRFTSPGTKQKAAGRFYSVTALFNGADSRLRSDGRNEGFTNTNTDPGPMGMAGLMLGGRQELQDNAFAATEIAELLVFGRALSETEMVQIEAYLESRYFP